LVHKDEKKKKKSIKTMVKLSFNSLVCTNEGVDVFEFIKKGNDFLAEPKNSDGCIVTMTLTDCSTGDQKDIKIKKDNKDSLSDKLDKYMHFSFRGIRFTIDTEEKTVQCNGAGLRHEMCGDKDKDGLYSINVETSN
jgi:hypothetical protein